jgi:prepilin-type N-terminal cleavage/methylation domain-containing protein
MQIFLTLHTKSSSHTSRYKEVTRWGFIQPTKGRLLASQSKTAGFTLIELLISVAIIGIITAIVLLKYSSFDSTTIMKGTAYEIALALREAQVKSVSVVRTDDNTFDNPYGISFTPGANTVASKEYHAFRYDDENDVTKFNPKYDIDDEDNTKARDVGSGITLERGMYIKSVCVTGGAGDRCDIERLDISFRRPEFNALFFAEGYGDGTDADMKKIATAQITLSSVNNIDAGFIIEVTKLGQISINPIP